RQLLLLDGSERAGGGGVVQPHCRGEGGLAAYEPGGVDQRVEAAGLVPASLGDVRLDLQDRRGPRRGHVGVEGRPVGHQQLGSFALWSLAQVSIADLAVSKVSTLTRRMSPLRAPLASSQLSAGTRNSCAPSSRAPTIFCWMPPIGPTVPSGAISPVPATR